MRMRQVWIGLLTVLVSLGIGTGGVGAQDEMLSHVIVISVDGLRPDAVQQGEMPTLQRLADDGAVSWTAETIMPPATLPGHVSMLTGLVPDEHGVWWNINTPRKISSPTFLTLAQSAGYDVAMSVGKEKLHQLHRNPRDVPPIDYEFARQGDRSVVDSAIAQLDAGANVLFVHLPNPDFFGHSEGWMSPTYMYELRNTDAQIERLITALEERNLRDSTLLIITADHGGSGDDHGADTPEDMQIPLIFSGVGVRDTRLDAGDNPLYTVEQVAPTVLWRLGIDRPEDMSEPVWAAFEDAATATPAVP